MTSPTGNPRQRLADWLQERSAAVRDCEQKARGVLYDDKNEPAYRELMKEKAALLASIADGAAPLVDALPAPEKSRVREILGSFSANARTALRIGSVFYMSALLYPDDHQEGEPDNLEKLVASLRET